MTSVLIIEDSESKSSAISAEVESYFGKEGCDITICSTFSAATKNIFEKKYDIILVDLLIPRRTGDQASDISDEIVEHITDSANNAGALVVAISQFSELVESKRKKFVDAGIIIIHFDPQKEGWKASLNVCLQRVERKQQVDFVVICALEKERNAYRSADCQIGDLSVIGGLDCLRLTVGSWQGVCVKLPRMGLVDAAVVSALAIETFSPRVIAMSGICGGFSGEVKIGTLVVSDTCWEHQAGKWSSDGFKTEHYQISIDGVLRARLSQFIERNGKFESIKQNLIDDSGVLGEGVFLKPSVTGSVVVASAERLEEIKKQHRKVAGLDMEMFGMYRAAELSSVRPICFGAKTVVDLADEKKGDSFHAYGCVISARFLVAALLELQGQ